MSRIKRIMKKFLPREHPEHGTWGWLEVGSPDTYFPLEAMGVAHDVLEHKLRPKVGIEEELMAFGAMLFIRYEGGYWAHRSGDMSNWHYQVSTELAEMMVKYRDSVLPCRSPRLSGDLEYQLMMSCDKALQEMFDIDERCTTVSLQTCENIKAWMRKGYRWAVNRYGSAVNACQLFREIQEQVARLDAEECYYNSETLTVSINYSEVSVKLTGGYDG